MLVVESINLRQIRVINLSRSKYLKLLNVLVQPSGFLRFMTSFKIEDHCIVMGVLRKMHHFVSSGHPWVLFSGL